MSDRTRTPRKRESARSSRALPEPDETELNMTPMIDIVFQLIVFFLLTLKFKTVDERIDAMLPKNIGVDTRPSPADERNKIKLKVFRRDVSDPERAYTLIKVDNAAQFRLPAGWRGRAKEELQHPQRVRAYDAVLARVQQEVSSRLAAYGGAGADVRGEIVAPPPRGGAVPHGDVISLLDTFLSEGITDVVFEGQPTPLNKRERAARAGTGR